MSSPEQIARYMSLRESPREVLRVLSGIQMVEVTIPTADGRELCPASLHRANG